MLFNYTIFFYDSNKYFTSATNTRTATTVITHIIVICAKKRYSVMSNAASDISGNWYWYAHY